MASRVRVAGRVQGVFFRAWTRNQATGLGVTGWVRNCPDGSVEAHLEGDEAAVKTLIQRIDDGPPAAVVDDVRVEEVEAEGCRRFDVRP